MNLIGAIKGDTRRVEYDSYELCLRRILLASAGKGDSDESELQGYQNFFLPETIQGFLRQGFRV